MRPGVGPPSAESVDILGLATWECCGHHTGCGSNCSANGLGFCNNGGDSSLDRVGMAYPVLPEKNSTCSDSCLPPGATNAPLGCNGYVCVKFDLTACTFTSIGGNLAAGFLDMELTA